MIFQVIVISGSYWIGKRIYDELTKSPTRVGDKHSKSLTGNDTPQDETLPEREQEACQNLALSGSGLALTIGGVFGAPALSLLAVPVLGYAFIPLIRDGWRELREKHRINYGLFITGMTAGCLAAQYYVLTSICSAVYYGSEVMLAKTRRRTRKTLESMFDDWPAAAWVRAGDAEISVPLMDLQPGDIVVVRAGEPIPVDGKVVAGAAGVDQSVVTGESVVAEKTIGDRVFASTFLLNGALDIHVEQAGRESLAGQIAEALRRMDSFESSVEHRSVKLAEASVAPTLTLSAIGWAVRGPIGSLTVAASNFTDLDRLVSPLSMLNYLSTTARAGIHVKDGRSLELLGDVDTIVFDKTGTLTVDRLSLIRIQVAEGWSNNEVLALAAAAEERQQHPIAAAIREAAEEIDLQIPPGISDTNSVGNGIIARVEGSQVLLGSQRYLSQEGIPIPISIQDQALAALTAGQTVIHIARDRQWVGQIVLQSTIRPEVAAMIAGFKSEGYKTAILSGDHEGPTRRLAEALGIDMWRAGVLPHEKTTFIEKLQAQGRSVCFIGDGINDGMALKAAHVSVSLSGASMVATDSAQIVLQQASLVNLRLLFDLSKRYRKDQKFIQGAVLANSGLSAGGALLFGLPLVSVYAIYFSTLAAGGVIAASPLLRGRRNAVSPAVRIQHSSQVAAPTGTTGR